MLALRVDQLSKRYRLGSAAPGTQTLRETIGGVVASVTKRGAPRRADADEFWALRDVTFELANGQALGVVGPNGAGKSTLLKILARVTSPTSGSAELRGRVGSLLEIGTGFHPELTGRDNVYLNGSILGMSRRDIQRNFDAIVAFGEVERFIDTPVKRYSSGMYVRLAFAVAAHLEPEILVVDEVLAVGDAAFQRKCLGKLRGIADEGRTVLFVSHNMAAIRQLCPTSVWLDHGRVRAQGPTDDVVTDYLRSTGHGSGVSESEHAPDQAKDFQLLSARAVDDAGNPASLFTCDDHVRIRLGCEVRRPVRDLYGYLEVRAADGATVIVSDSRDVGDDPFESAGVGPLALEVALPPRSLAPGEYSVYLNFSSLLSGEIVDAPGIVCSFALSDPRSLRGDRRGGYFSTLLDWSPIGPARPVS